MLSSQIFSVNYRPPSHHLQCTGGNTCADCVTISGLSNTRLWQIFAYIRFGLHCDLTLFKCVIFDYNLNKSWLIPKCDYVSPEYDLNISGKTMTDLAMTWLWQLYIAISYLTLTWLRAEYDQNMLGMTMIRIGQLDDYFSANYDQTKTISGLTMT